ncbi:hypothetical protein L1887_47429 [Cichorium endivia]|nr:hypothetical protein L1887_47429 [Cichorium endivia]
MLQAPAAARRTALAETTMGLQRRSNRWRQARRKRWKASKRWTTAEVGQHGAELVAAVAQSGQAGSAGAAGDFAGRLGADAAHAARFWACCSIAGLRKSRQSVSEELPQSSRVSSGREREARDSNRQRREVTPPPRSRILAGVGASVLDVEIRHIGSRRDDARIVLLLRRRSTWEKRVDRVSIHPSTHPPIQPSQSSASNTLSTSSAYRGRKTPSRLSIYIHHLTTPLLAIMSSIPVPQSVKRQRSTATLPAAAGPSKLREPGAARTVAATRSISTADNGRFVPARRTATTASAGLTLPRAPMTNTTNRPAAAAATRSVSASKVAPSAAARRGVTSVTRLRPGTNAANAAAAASRTSNGSAGSAASGDVDPSRMDAMESRLASMAELFELERTKTEEKWNKERSERLAQEDKVRQLEEDLLEQRKIAQSKQEEIKRRRTLADDEMLQLTAKFNREKRLLETELEQERETVAALKATLNQQSTSHLTMESTNTALRSQIQTKAANAHLENELREAESLRRKLHNEVQELRGNIRVFCRVRPPSNNDANNGTEALATIRFPNEREANQIELLAAAESATGTVTMRNHLFSFDRVFQPSASQADVFEEIAHLTQSVLDGYNTSIFAYGQTGSGKTHTLEGAPDSITGWGSNPAADAGAGLIPRAVQMLWSTAESLKDKGWRYDFEGSMLEIYLDNINDLLGKSEVDKAKHEIKHDKGRTSVSDTVVVPLDSPAHVFALLDKAKKRRQVAATLMNERSSRSHSVFMLRVRGHNTTTMEACDAVLSLVDLAGSERLANSGSDKDPVRLKEAQSINKSLSSLADVISALGQNKTANHVPYRNSTLTWLLKNSLGGNSKTLMLLALSPMAAHLNESLCSLRFATKVNSTTIGTAKAVKSVAS